MNNFTSTKSILTEAKQKLDIGFIKAIAKDEGHNISDADAKKAHKQANSQAGNANDYVEALEEYFK